MLKELIKEILKEELLENKQVKISPKMPCVVNGLIGKVCMFRTYSAGVHFGTLVNKNGKECLIENSRRVWCWYGACSLSQLANEGSKELDKCKIAQSVNTIILTEVIEIIPMNAVAINQLMKAVAWEK